jgi:hypothetical protein
MAEENPQDRLIRLADEKALAQSLVDAYRELGEESAKLEDATLQLAKAEQAVARELLKQSPASKQLAKDLIDATKAVEEATKAFEDLKKEMGQGEQKAEQLLGSLFKIGGFSQKLTQLMPRSATQVKGFAKALTGAKIASAALTAAGAALLNSTVALAKAQDEAVSSFRQATGASKEYNYEITQTERRNFIAGVSAKDASAAFNTLYSSFSAFTQLNESQRAALQDTTVLLQKLGVDAGTTGAIFDQVFRAAGGSVEDANDTMLEIAGTAKSLGVPMKQLANDFTSAFGTLVQYGERANEVFKGLAVQAKNTGLSVGDLIKITAQFDTFDGAARSVGRLNAILGGPYLNSIDMLNASEEERISILTRQVEMAGIQFDALQKYEQRAIASSLGMSVEEANRLFRMGEEQYQLDALRQEELLEQSREVQTIAQELKSMFMALAVDMRPLIDNLIKPFIKGIGTIAQTMGSLTSSIGPAFKMLLPAAGLAMLLMGIPTGGATVPIGLKLLALSSVVALGASGAAGQAIKPTSRRSAITPSTQGGGGRSSIGGMVSRQQGASSRQSARLADSIDALNKNMQTSRPGRTEQKVVLEVGGTQFAEATIGALNSPAGRGALSPLTNA